MYGYLSYRKLVIPCKTQRSMSTNAEGNNNNKGKNKRELTNITDNTYNCTAVGEMVEGINCLQLKHEDGTLHP